jgi:hypothetical protein
MIRKERGGIEAPGVGLIYWAFSLLCTSIHGFKAIGIELARHSHGENAGL